MFAGLKIKIILGTTVIMLLMGIGLWVKSISNDRDRLGKELAQEQALHAVSRESVTTLFKEVEDRNEEIKVINRKFSEIRTATSATVSTLLRHDLSYLALKKPGLIGNRINAATNERLRWLEELTTAYSEGRDPIPVSKTDARTVKLARTRMGNYRGPLFCTDSTGYESLARMTAELDRYIQQIHQRCE